MAHCWHTTPGRISSRPAAWRCRCTARPELRATPWSLPCDSEQQQAPRPSPPRRRPAWRTPRPGLSQERRVQQHHEIWANLLHGEPACKPWVPLAHLDSSQEHWVLLAPTITPERAADCPGSLDHYCGFCCLRSRRNALRLLSGGTRRLSPPAEQSCGLCSPRPRHSLHTQRHLTRLPPVSSEHMPVDH